MILQIVRRYSDGSGFEILGPPSKGEHSHDAEDDLFTQIPTYFLMAKGVALGTQGGDEVLVLAFAGDEEYMTFLKKHHYL
jgi:hypothetical protein